MIALRAQTGPVFLTYRASSRRGGNRGARTAEAPPLIDFNAADGVRHTMWKVDCSRLRRPRRGSWRGFRRCTSPTAITARRARRERGPNSNGAGESSAFLAVAFPARSGADPAVQPHREEPGDADAG